MGVEVPERVLHEAWRRADGSRASLSTADGKRYRVLYSGMPGGSYGPDFRDAVLEGDDGSEFVGDVEVHRHPADWFSHGHDSDPKYGLVMFHAVGTRLANDGSTARTAVVNSMGFEVPELSIGQLIDDHGKPTFDRSGGAIGDHTDVAVGDWLDDDWLDDMGDERFALKISSAHIDVEEFGPDLALQMAVFECLGYPRNRGAFRHLAKRLPWAFLAGLARSKEDAREGGGGKSPLADRACELLGWGAGFSERPSWSPVRRLVGDLPKWTGAAGRPANRPEARMAAAAHLVVAWWLNGGPLRHALVAIGGSEQSSMIREHYRSGDGSLGAGRAGEIVVNAVLPVLAAWAEAGRDDALYAKVLRFYRKHPSLPSNSVYEEAKRVLVCRGFGFERLRGARRQQGVMHIYRLMLLRPRTARQLRLGHRAL